MSEYERILAQADELETSGNLEAALTALESLSQIPIEDYPAWLPDDLDLPRSIAMARIHTVLGQLDEAAEDVRFDVWQCFILGGYEPLWEWTIPQAMRTLQVMPDSAPVWIFLAEGLIETGESEDGILAYRRACDLLGDGLDASNPESEMRGMGMLWHVANRGLGEGLVQAEAYSEAIDVLEPVLARFPGDWEAAANFADAYMFSEDFSNAYPLYQQLVEVAPDNVVLRQRLAITGIPTQPLEVSAENCKNVYQDALDNGESPAGDEMCDVAQILAMLALEYAKANRKSEARQWLELVRYCNPAEAAEFEANVPL